MDRQRILKLLVAGLISINLVGCSSQQNQDKENKDDNTDATYYGGSHGGYIGSGRSFLGGGGSSGESNGGTAQGTSKGGGLGSSASGGGAGE